MSNTHTDIAKDFLNQPFVTLTESKIPNHWYHKDYHGVFMLTKSGFKLIAQRKKFLEENNFL